MNGRLDTVGQLIAYLQEYAKPDDSVSVMVSHYNGDTEVYDDCHLALVVGYNHVTITPDDVYHKREAQSYGGLFCTIHNDGTVT